MGSTTDRIKGLANEAVGNAKQGIGEVIGDQKLQVEGKVQEVKGEGQQATADVKDSVKNAADKAADAINRKL